MLATAERGRWTVGEKEAKQTARDLTANDSEGWTYQAVELGATWYGVRVVDADGRVLGWL